MLRVLYKCWANLSIHTAKWATWSHYSQLCSKGGTFGSLGKELIVSFAWGRVFFLKEEDSGHCIGMCRASFEKIPMHGNKIKEHFLSPHLNNKMLDCIPRALGASGAEENRQVTEGKVLKMPDLEDWPCYLLHLRNKYIWLKYSDWHFPSITGFWISCLGNLQQQVWFPGCPWKPSHWRYVLLLQK